MDDEKDTQRLEWIAMHGAGIRRSGNAQRNLMVWGAAWPIPIQRRPSMLDQIRAAIDRAMEREHDERG